MYFILEARSQLSAATRRQHDTETRADLAESSARRAQGQLLALQSDHEALQALYAKVQREHQDTLKALEQLTN